MRSFRETCVSLWHGLNPSEPSSGYLIKFVAVAMVLFVIAYLIGQA